MARQMISGWRSNVMGAAGSKLRRSPMSTASAATVCGFQPLSFTRHETPTPLARGPPQIRVDRDGERRQPLVGNREGLDVKAQRQITATGGRECPFTKHLREWRRHRVRPPHDRNRWVDSISNDGPRAVEDSGLQIRPPHTMSGHDSEFVPEPGGLFIQFLYEPRLDFLPQARNRILLFLRGRHELKLQRGNHPVKGGLLTESFANPPLVLVQEHAAELCEPWGGRRGC
jgi:hypothetical protein